MSGENGVKRDETGRFLPGTSGGPGGKRSGLSLRHQMLKAALESTDPADVIRVLDTLKKQALAGDTLAAKTWLSYVVGRPDQFVEIRTTDSSEDRAEVAATVARNLGIGLVVSPRPSDTGDAE